MRGTDLLDAATKLARHMGIEFNGSTGWLWQSRKRHGIGHKKVQGESGEPWYRGGRAVPPEAAGADQGGGPSPQPQIYNADDTAVFWRSLPVNTQASKDEDKVPGKKISKDKFSALLGANASGTHCLKPVVVGKAAKPRCLKDQMDSLPVIYYNTSNSWFNAAIFEDWFFNHFVPEVLRYQEGAIFSASLFSNHRTTIIPAAQHVSSLGWQISRLPVKIDWGPTIRSRHLHTIRSQQEIMAFTPIRSRQRSRRLPAIDHGIPTTSTTLFR